MSLHKCKIIISVWVSIDLKNKQSNTLYVLRYCLTKRIVYTVRLIGPKYLVIVYCWRAIFYKHIYCFVQRSYNFWTQWSSREADIYIYIYIYLRRSKISAPIICTAIYSVSKKCTIDNITISCLYMNSISRTFLSVLLTIPRSFISSVLEQNYPIGK